MVNKKVVLLSLSVVFFIIGVHQSFYFGIQASYWAFMIVGLGFLGLQYLRKKEEEEDEEETGPSNKNRLGKKSKNKKRK